MALAKKAVSILVKMNWKTIDINLESLDNSSLIMHKWSEKAKKQIRDKQAKKAKSAKQARNPEQEFRDAIYKDDTGYYFPSIAFKKAATEACRQVDDLSMALAKTLFFVNGENVYLETNDPVMREDTVVIGQGTTDLRYRPEFSKWKATINVSYNADVISEEQLVNLFNLAGTVSGIGENRPNKTGNIFGQFRVVE